MTAPTATFTAYVSFDEESGMFYGVVPGVHGAHTQAATLNELTANLREVLELCASEGTFDPASLPSFVGLQQVQVSL
jgi:predicted RNase H-like HicB family nuclease